MKARIATANLLLDGRVVFLTRTGEWTRDTGNAAYAHDDVAADELLRLARRGQALNIVVDPYLIDVIIDEAGLPSPQKSREIIRVKGPSIQADSGYQAKRGTASPASDTRLHETNPTEGKYHVSL